MHQGDRLLADRPHQVRALALPARDGQHRRGPREQGAEDFPDREIEAEGGLDQHAVAGLHGIGALRPQQAVHHPAMRHLDPLRTPRRAGGVDDVGEVVRPGAAVRPRSARRGDLFPVRVQADPADRQLRQRRGQVLLGQHQPRAGVLQQEGQAVGRQLRVERQVGRTALEHAQQAHHHLQRALGAHGDQIPSPHSPPAKVIRHPVGPLLQLAVGQPLQLEDDGLRVGRDLHPALERAVQRRIRRQVLAGVVPFDQRLVPLRRGRQGQHRQRPLRLARDRFEHRREVPAHALHRHPVEEIGGVLEGARQAAARPPQHQGEVELGHPAVHGQWRERQPRQRLHGRTGRALQSEHHLEQRGMAEAPFRLQLLDHPLEGYVLVRVSAQRGFPDPFQQHGERGGARHRGPQDQGVDEEADQRLGLQPVAAGDRRADDQVLQPRIAV